MRSSKSNAVPKLVFLALSAIIVIAGGFMVTMIILWAICFVLLMMFQGALWKGYGTKGVILSYIASNGAQNGLTATEVYMRGRNVTGAMILIIPLLYITAR